MTTIVGRNLKVEVALTFAAAAAFTAVTKANPAVATLTAHGIADGTVGYWDVAAGMTELHEQATYTDNADTNTLELAGLDATDYTTYTAGNFYAAATWGLIDEAYGYGVGGGAADAIPDDRLHLGKHSNIAGLNAAEDMNIAVRPPIVESAPLAFCMAKARRGLKVLIKCTDLATAKVVRVVYGTPSVYNEQLDVGGGATGGFALIVPKYVIKPNA